MKLGQKVRRGEGGFTLVELLIVLAILAILVAIVLSNFTGLLSGSKATANSAELNIVQTAVDVRMANESLAEYPAGEGASDTKDMTDAAGGFNLYPDYMRSSTSNCFYSVVAATAKVSQGDCP